MIYVNEEKLLRGYNTDPAQLSTALSLSGISYLPAKQHLHLIRPRRTRVGPSIAWAGRANFLDCSSSVTLPGVCTYRERGPSEHGTRFAHRSPHVRSERRLGDGKPVRDPCTGRDDGTSLQALKKGELHRERAGRNRDRVRCRSRTRRRTGRQRQGSGFWIVSRWCPRPPPIVAHQPVPCPERRAAFRWSFPLVLFGNRMMV
jgi:hypothetical protein